MFCAADMPHGWHLTSWVDAITLVEEATSKLRAQYGDTLDNLKDLAVYSQMALTLYREEQDA
jgi:hypothetical protein